MDPVREGADGCGVEPARNPVTTGNPCVAARRRVPAGPLTGPAEDRHDASVAIHSLAA